MSNKPEFKPSGKDIAKFIIVSLIGVFLFLVPIRIGGSQPNIMLGHAIDWLGGPGSWMRSVTFGDLGTYALGQFDLRYLIAMLAITASFVMSLVAMIFKPAFIMNNEKIKNIFVSSPIFFISKAIGAIIIWMLFLGIGPDFLINNFTGDVMIGLVAGLVVIFIFLGPTMPLLTEFGLMEFVGILIRKFVRVLFTLPGRAAIDLMASWFGSSAAAVIITRNQHEKGFYTGREAAVNATCFAFVSLPFTFVVFEMLSMAEQFDSFWRFYLAICAICLLLAIVMPRIPPLRGIKDEYLPEVGKQIEEDVPEGTPIFKLAFSRATKRAHGTTAGDVVKSGAMSWLSIFMDLIPIILAWGTLALVLFESTPIFDWLSWPLGAYMNVLGVPEAFDFAAAALVGFVDMFIPAILLSGEAVPGMTKFVIGVLSIVQIIYLAETGALIIKSKIPLGIGKLFIIFIIRTVIALPLIVLLANLLFRG
ncbi:MAG: YjiH family protein [Oscillospiraceae bacterium]|nr:YjiH family protein [Oscillospiraceae bacterium]